jgi:hypothetical protein
LTFGEVVKYEYLVIEPVLLPKVTLPLESTVTKEYVPATTPEFAKVAAAEPGPAAVTSPVNAVI